MPVLLDTSVLISSEAAPAAGDEVGAISVVSLTELHHGVLIARDEGARAQRLRILGLVERNFSALPITDHIAREWSRLYAAIASRGGSHRRRALDLAIAATANVHGATLLTHNVKAFSIIEDLVEVRAP